MTGRKLGEFADAIRGRRKERHLSLGEVAERTELTVTRISALERNVEQPTHWEVEALAKALSLHNLSLRRFAAVQLGKAKPHVTTAITALREALGLLDKMAFDAPVSSAMEQIEIALWALEKEAVQP